MPVGQKFVRDFYSLKIDELVSHYVGEEAIHSTVGPWATLFLVLVKVRAAQNSCTSKQFSLTKIRVEQNKISWYSSQIYIYDHVSK